MFKTRLISAAAVAAVLISSCDKDESNGPTTIAGGAMSATIAGNAWMALLTTFNNNPTSQLQFTGERNPTGTLATGIGVEITSYSGARNYIIDSGAANAYLVLDNKLYTATTGQVNVAADDASSLRATFSFNAADSSNQVKSVQGTFNYRKQ